MHFRPLNAKKEGLQAWSWRFWLYKLWFGGISVWWGFKCYESDLPALEGLGKWKEISEAASTNFHRLPYQLVDWALLEKGEYLKRWLAFSLRSTFALVTSVFAEHCFASFYSLGLLVINLHIIYFLSILTSISYVVKHEVVSQKMRKSGDLCLDLAIGMPITIKQTKKRHKQDIVVRNTTALVG